MLVQTRANGGVKLITQELSRLEEFAKAVGHKIDRAKKGTPYVFIPEKDIGILFESEFSVVTVDPETLMSFARTVDRI